MKKKQKQITKTLIIVFSMAGFLILVWTLAIANRNVRFSNKDINNSKTTKQIADRDLNNVRYSGMGRKDIGEKNKNLIDKAFRSYFNARNMNVSNFSFGVQDSDSEWVYGTVHYVIDNQSLASANYYLYNIKEDEVKTSLDKESFIESLQQSSLTK
jgi:hypothetical protein